MEQQGNMNNFIPTAQALYHLLTSIKMTWTFDHHGVQSRGGQGKNSSYCVKTSNSTVRNKNLKLFGCNIHKCCQLAIAAVLAASPPSHFIYCYLILLPPHATDSRSVSWSLNEYTWLSFTLGSVLLHAVQYHCSALAGQGIQRCFSCFGLS